VFGCLGTGIPRLCEGKYFVLGMRIRHSQNGNVAHAAVGLLAIGGFTLGGWVFGGLALGWQAFGGLALGWNAAMGGLAIAHDFAVGGVAHAARANGEIAMQFMKASPFFSRMQILSHYIGWLNLLWLIALSGWWRVLKAGKHSRSP
jgi:hypothetical protein